MAERTNSSGSRYKICGFPHRNPSANCRSATNVIDTFSAGAYAFQIVVSRPPRRFASGFAMNCPGCGTSVPAHARECPGCFLEAGFPNVRQARLAPEVGALAARVHTAEISAASRKVSKQLKEFGHVVGQRSVAVIARSLQTVHWLASDENALYVSFQKQLSMGSRTAENNKWDQSRTAVESALYPNYSPEIVFGALTLDGSGVFAYGAYCMVLKSSMISSRATLFEENPFEFMKRHKIVIGTTAVPFGYRSTWEQRGDLARAKLHPKITRGAGIEDFPGILLDLQAGTTGSANCVEVHIYGGIHRRAIERVVGRKPTNRADAAIAKSLRAKLADIGATLELL
jgi:hypothetical protein